MVELIRLDNVVYENVVDIWSNISLLIDCKSRANVDTEKSNNLILYVEVLEFDWRFNKLFMNVYSSSYVIDGFKLQSIDQLWFASSMNLSIWVYKICNLNYSWTSCS